LNLTQKHSYIWKYETVAAYAVLAFQYFIVSVFPERIGKEMVHNYVYLWYFDIALTIPIIFLTFFSPKYRIFLLLSILVLTFIGFYNKLGLDKIVINTYISIIMANRFLFFTVDEKERSKIITSKMLRLLLSFGFAILAVIIDSLLGYLGLYQHIKVGDGVVMSPYGKIIVFCGLYSLLAYLEYRKIKKNEI